MIAEIDRLRSMYVDSISRAMSVAHALRQLDAGFNALEHVPSADALDEMQRIAERVLDERSRAEHDMRQAGRTIHVGGDFIQVGDIVESSNIAVGKNITQCEEGGAQ